MTRAPALARFALVSLCRPRCRNPAHPPKVHLRNQPRPLTCPLPLAHPPLQAYVGFCKTPSHCLPDIRGLRCLHFPIGLRNRLRHRRRRSGRYGRGALLNHPTHLLSKPASSPSSNPPPPPSPPTRLPRRRRRRCRAPGSAYGCRVCRRCKRVWLRRRGSELTRRCRSLGRCPQAPPPAEYPASP